MHIEVCLNTDSKLTKGVNVHGCFTLFVEGVPRLCPTSIGTGYHRTSIFCQIKTKIQDRGMEEEINVDSRSTNQMQTKGSGTRSCLSLA